TANITLAANLPATDTTTSPPRTVTVPVFDSLGSEHDLTLNLQNSGSNTWTVTASFANAGTSTATTAAGADTIAFNPDGTLDAANTTFTGVDINWDPAVTGATSPQTVAVNVGTDGQANGLSQFGTPFTVSRVNQDGIQAGNLIGLTVDAHGIVTAGFDNGQQVPIYILPIATFPNPDGLTPQ